MNTKIAFALAVLFAADGAMTSGLAQNAYWEKRAIKMLPPSAEETYAGWWTFDGKCNRDSARLMVSPGSKAGYGGVTIQPVDESKFKQSSKIPFSIDYWFTEVTPAGLLIAPNDAPSETLQLTVTSPGGRKTLQIGERAAGEGGPLFRKYIGRRLTLCD